MKRFLLGAFLVAAAATTGFAEENVTVLEEVVVTGTREAELVRETPVTVNVIKGEEVKNVKPTHPAELMNRVPGVWITSTGGEGHITSMRQPLTTSPVYLFLEDGIPIRPTGFFNHNALYEVDMPGSERVEVMKGTGSALYGSDAIGGTINTMTRPAPLTPQMEVSPEIGSYGWYKLLLSGGNTVDNDGFRLNVNYTHTDGWRSHKEYDRTTVSLREDHVFSGGATAKTVVSYSLIDQNTSGAAPLTKDDYETRPEYNYHTFDYRWVEAFRISTAFEKEFGDDKLVSLIPYARRNEMKLLPEWGIFKSGANYFGYESDSKFNSFGLLTKYRQDFEPLRTRVIIGLDLDYSPGQYEERRIQVLRDPSTLKYESYSYVASTNNYYNYYVNFMESTPYAQVEVSPVQKLRLTAGARYDYLSYDYTNNLSTTTNRPGSTTKTFKHLSPKFGATYQFTDDLSAYASYNKGFRAPSPSDLFRAGGTAATAVDLAPVKVDSYDAGVRAKFYNMFSLDTAVYYMEKKDDIVSFKPATGDSQKLNAGKTVHKGVEVGLGVEPVKDVSFDVSYSYSKHEYDDWVVSLTKDLSGKEISAAPRQILSARLGYKPAVLNGGNLELEWFHLGSYWLDDENTEKYDGHELLNLRGSYNVTKSLEVYAKVLNLLDRKYAEKVSKSSNGAVTYGPGQPIALYAGLVYTWGK